MIVTPHTYAQGVRIVLSQDLIVDALCELAVESSGQAWDEMWINLREAVEMRRVAESENWRDLDDQWPGSQDGYLDRASMAIDEAVKPLLKGLSHPTIDLDVRQTHLLMDSLVLGLVESVA